MSDGLDLEAYRSSIHLDEHYIPPATLPIDFERRDEIVDKLLCFLNTERGDTRFDPKKTPYETKRNQLKALLTMRPPGRLPEALGKELDQLLQTETIERNTIDARDVARCNPDGLSPGLWQGDITQLKIDAIVNAANSELLGCFRPYHHCIDNAIHRAAGPRVREDCNTIMEMQGEPDNTGHAKITRGYHLPAKYILHTVGPIVTNGKVTGKAADRLSGCYQACLNLAVRVPAIRSIAFCCISTGVFGFPKAQAAKIAISSVRQWTLKNPHALDNIVFSVFQDLDFNLYKRLLSADDFI